MLLQEEMCWILFHSSRNANDAWLWRERQNFGHAALFKKITSKPSPNLEWVTIWCLYIYIQHLFSGGPCPYHFNTLKSCLSVSLYMRTDVIVQFLRSHYMCVQLFYAVLEYKFQKEKTLICHHSLPGTCSNLLLLGQRVANFYLVYLYARSQRKVI